MRNQSNFITVKHAVILTVHNLLWYISILQQPSGWISYTQGQKLIRL